MKKYLFSIILVALLLVLTVGIASANGGPHGSFATTTDSCASCHRTHTATNARLLMQSPAAICLSCHGAAATGANTNVEDGKYLSTRDDAGGNWNHGATLTPDNSNLLGGGFTNYKGVAVSSNHTVGQTSAWGQGATDRGVATALAAGATLQCVSCHDPHGNTNYRMFKSTVNATAVVVPQVDEAAKDYDTEGWGASQSQICKACHNAYHQTAAGQGSTLSGSTYTHRVDMAWNSAFAGALNPETVGLGGITLPLGETGTNNTVVCQTCHLPHGTSASMTTLASGPVTADSALLRVDNRGVCEVCHQK
ncbi:MAG: hypothetical protein HZB50_16525 [Chloroflexi bacterium]|nr:hypothetical protein [Chloroflexota bacterium]